MDRLKACPFCACTVRIESNRDWHRIVGEHDDRCPFVERETMMVPASAEQLAFVVADWNRRVRPKPTLAMIEDWLDRKLMAMARHGRVECQVCGTFNKRGYPCRYHGKDGAP